MQDKSLMFYMIRSELEDAVGVENVSTKEIERAVYSVDYFWLSRKWQDAGEQGPMPDIIVRPGTTEEVSKVMKIANYYKIPVTTWGGGSGSQGGALPVAGGILLDIKRLDKLIELNTEAGFVTCETGMIFATLEDLVNEKGYSVMHLPSCMTCCTVGGGGAGPLAGKAGLWQRDAYGRCRTGAGACGRHVPWVRLHRSRAGIRQSTRLQCAAAHGGAAGPRTGDTAVPESTGPHSCKAASGGPAL